MFGGYLSRGYIYVLGVNCLESVQGVYVLGVSVRGYMSGVLCHTTFYIDLLQDSSEIDNNQYL